MTNTAVKNKDRNTSLDNLIGPTDAKIDAQARERIVTSRIGLLLKHSFFGNLATRLQLVNADEWLPTAAVDGVRFYYNSRFIMKLKPKEVDFLVAHEILHLVYDHLGRRDDRDPQIYNIACDYAVNADLKRQRIGQFITTVPCLYETKYDGKPSEEIYADLMKNVQKLDLDQLLDQMIDQHMDGQDENDGDGDAEGKKGPVKMSDSEREQVKQELRQAILSAAQSAEAGSLPKGVERLIKDLTNPVMPWRDLLQVNLTSAIKNDYSWMRPSRRGWHMDAVMPGMTPGEEIDVAVAIDMSGSISDKQAKSFLSEVVGMIEAFDGFKLHIFCFDTEIYNAQDFSSDNLDSVDTYEPKGGGGTDFTAIYRHLKDNDNVPKRLIVFTDGLPYGSWGDPDYCDVTWIIHGSKDIVPPFGQWAYYDDK